MSEPRLRLAPDVAFLSLANRPVIFSPRSEAVFDLQGDAVELARLLAQGTTIRELMEMLINKGWPAEQSQALLLSLLADWSKLKLLYMDALGPIAWRESFVVGDMSFCVASTSSEKTFEPSHIFQRSGEPPKAKLPSFTLVPMLGHVTIRLPSGEIVVAPSQEAAPELKSAVIGDMLRRTQSIALHAACLVSKGEAILLIGPPGAGKSTLAAALCSKGFRYAGDDITLLCEGKALGVCVALTLKAGAPRLLSREDEPLLSSLPFRRRDGIQLAYDWPLQIADEGPYPIAAMVRLNRVDTLAPSLDDCDPLGLMKDVLAEAFSAKGSASLMDLKMLDEVFGRASSLELCYSKLEDGTRLLSDRFL